LIHTEQLILLKALSLTQENEVDLHSFSGGLLVKNKGLSRSAPNSTFGNCITPV